MRAFAAEGGKGCNVTVPFKFEAAALADAAAAPRAALAEACNMLRFDGDGWLGDNTDGIGLVRDIERNAGVALPARDVLLIGAGGARRRRARAAARGAARAESWWPTARRPRRGALVRAARGAGARSTASRCAAPALDDVPARLRRRHQRHAPAA